MSNGSTTRKNLIVDVNSKIMDYESLIQSLQIAAKYDYDYDKHGLGTSCNSIGFGIEQELILYIRHPSIEDIIKLQSLGWSIGSDEDAEDEDIEKWNSGFNNMTEDEIKKMYGKYNSVSIFI